MQRMTEPPDDTNAGSLISVRGCFRFSSMASALTIIGEQANGKH